MQCEMVSQSKLSLQRLKLNFDRNIFCIHKNESDDYEITIKPLMIIVYACLKEIGFKSFV